MKSGNSDFQIQNVTDSSRVSNSLMRVHTGQSRLISSKPINNLVHIVAVQNKASLDKLCRAIKRRFENEEFG